MVTHLFFFGSTILYTFEYMSIARTHKQMDLQTLDCVATTSGTKSLLSMYALSFRNVMSGI